MKKNIRQLGLPEKPSQLGFRMPAEWKRHEATWLAWPHNRTDWPSKLNAIHWVYGEIARKLVSGERVRILVNSKQHETRAHRYLDRVGIDISQVEFFRISTDRGWIRDFGPIFLLREGAHADVAIARFRFNAWARYPDWQKDDAVPVRLAPRLGCQLLPIKISSRDVVLEGGSIDVNGSGTLLTTEECLLHPTIQLRNPGFTRQDYEEIFRKTFGVTNVIWLGRGIAGDDTHGHIDDICRFVGPQTVVLCQEKDSQDENYQALFENRERLEDASLEDGSKIEIISLPMPSPLFFKGQRLPASYANFYISNNVVLVPTFNDQNDRIALGILGEWFRDRTVVGIHAVDLVWGFGTLHCLTQQQPARTSD